MWISSKKVPRLDRFHDLQGVKTEPDPPAIRCLATSAATLSSFRDHLLIGLLDQTNNKTRQPSEVGLWARRSAVRSPVAPHQNGVLESSPGL